MNLQTDIRLKQEGRIVSAARGVRPPKISSQVLLGPGGELRIEHGGREYRLRLTQNDKLILTA